MTDTQGRVFEVFHQRSRGEAHVHVGAIHAYDAGMALVMAKEQYGRHPTCVNLWVVDAEHIHATSYEDADMFAPAFDKSYREAFGYETTKRAREVGDMQEI
jgi:ring-1,2-phenylacetyl-CoA epoxidase subunit PaaB